MNKRSFLSIFLQILLVFSPLAMFSSHAAAGKLAIVIDDIGYRAKEDGEIYRLPKAVAVAIIPSAPMATARAKQAFDEQRDVLIHLPMQPKSITQPIEAGALKVGMDAAQVARLIDFSRERVPYAIGLNNHMGSRATADQALMSHLMQSLSQQKLFFLDSKTAGDSVAYKTARSLGIPALERHIFLDDSDAYGDVERQFAKAIDYARKHGLAIMIGHPRKNSVAVLKKGLANLPSDIDLVSMASLWRGEKIEPTKPFKLQFGEAAQTSVEPFQYVPLLRGVPQE